MLHGIICLKDGECSNAFYRNHPSRPPVQNKKRGEQFKVFISYHNNKKKHNDSVGFAAGRVSGVEAAAAWCVRVSGRAGPTSNTIAVASKGEAVGPTSDWYLHVDVLNKRI